VARQVLETRADAVAGIVDQQVDAPEAVERPSDDAVHLARVGDVAGER
jgi:hypothetical protein